MSTIYLSIKSLHKDEDHQRYCDRVQMAEVLIRHFEGTHSLINPLISQSIINILIS